MRLILLTTLLFVTSALPAFSTTYYVSPSGSDLADGLTPGTAWQSIDNGDRDGEGQILNPGDTINIMPGEYLLTAPISLLTGGDSTAHIVYRKVGKAPAVIDGNATINTLILVEGDYLEIHGLDLTNNKEHGFQIDGDYCTVTGCSLYDIDNFGFRVIGNNNIIQKNIITSSQDDAIRNEDNADYNQYYGNTIYGCTKDGMELKGGLSRAFNNIIVQNDVGIRGTATDVCGFNNVWGNPSGNYISAVDSAGGISVLPKFVNAAAGRFDLMAGASEIDAGLDLGYRFNGAAPDMGAFEKYNIYYIGPAGNDAFNGLTLDSAWASIDNGDSLLFPGDTVYVQPGTYVDSVVITDSGQVDDMIAFVGARDSCLINGAGHANAVRITAQYVLWSGINVAGASSANIYILGGNNLVRESILSRGGLYGLRLVEGEGNEFVRNVFSLNGSANLYIRDDHSTVYNCSFFDSAGYGIDAQGYQYQTISNCIFLGKSGEDVAVYANATSDLTYSLFYNNLTRNAGGIGLGTGCFSADPDLIAPEAGNFRLQTYSPAIDAGVYVGLPFEGSAPDRGAYETGILDSLAIIPVYDSLIADSAYQFSVEGFDSLGFPANPGVISWSHTFADGSIDLSGNFRPQSVGPGQILAQSSIGDISAVSAVMVVVPGMLQTLIISPNRDTISADDTRQFAVTGYDQWDNEVGDVGSLTWQVLDYIGTIDASGLFDADRAGDGFIRVTSDLGPSKISDTITVIPGSIADIKVTPPNNVVVQNTSYQYLAYGIDADSNIVRDLTDSVVWATSDPDGSITAAGFYTAGNDVSPPSYYVMATYQGIMTDSGTVTVINNSALDYVQIENWDGSPFNDTTLSTDDDNTALYCRGYNLSDVLLGDVSVTWSILGLDSIGSINPLTGTSTTLRLTKPGTGQVRVAYSPSIVDTTGVITCLPGLPNSGLVTPDTATVSADSTLSFSMALFDADGNPTDLGPVPVWSVKGGIGTIDASGLFTPGNAGIGYIIGTCGSFSDTTAEITVIPGELSYVRVTPDSVIVSADSSVTFVANGYDAQGNLCDPGLISWELTSALGTIDDAGLFDATAVGIGGVIATSSLGPTDTSAYLEVIPGRLTALVIVPDSVEVSTDSTIVFSVTGTDSDGNPTSIGTVDWSVIGDVGDINSFGLFTPSTIGSGRITAASDFNDVSDTNQIVIVNPGQLFKLVVSPDTDTLQVGDTINFTAAGYDRKYNLTDVGQLSWTVFGGIGTVDNAGLFVATTPGIGDVKVVSSLGAEDITSNILVEAVSISAIPLGDRYVRPHQHLVPVLAFRINNFHAEDKLISAVSVRDNSRGVGSADDLITNIDSVTLFLDFDNDSLLSPSDIALNSAQYVSGSIDLLFAPVSIPTGEGLNFILGAYISSYPHDGDSIDVYIETSSDVYIDDTTVVLGPETVNSLGYSFVDGMVAEQLVMTPVGTALINPGDTIYNCLTVDIPRNGYRADTLQLINLANAGTAGDDDIDSLILYADDGNGIWGGPSEETRLGILAFTGIRWTRSGLTVPLNTPLTRFYVGADLSQYPDNGSTIALFIPSGGLELASNNDGPIDGPTIPADTIVIETNETVSITAVPIPFRKLIPGQASGPLAGFELVNGYAANLVIDSLSLLLLASDPIGATQEQLDSQIDSLHLYLNRDGDYAVLSGTDLLVGTAIPDNGRVVFTTGGLVIPLNGGTIGLSVTAFLNMENCRNGNSLNVSINDSSGLYLSQPAVIAGAFPLKNYVNFVIDAFPAARIGINPIEVGTLFGGQTNRLVMDFTLPGNGYAADLLQSLMIYNTGTLNEFDALLSVKLWADLGTKGYSPEDLLVGRFVPQSLFWELKGLAHAISSAGGRFYITVDILADQSEAGTLLFKIPVGGAVYLSGMTGPDDEETGNDEAHLVFPSNRIFAISIPAAAATLKPQSTNNVILSFALYNGYIDQDQTLEAIGLTNISRSASSLAYADYELGQVSLYIDTDSSRTFNGDSLIATGIFDDGHLQLSGLDIGLAPEALKYFFAVVDVPLDLIDADSLAVDIASTPDIIFSDPVSIGGDLPLKSGSYLIVDGSIRRQYSLIDSPARSASPGDTSVTLLAFTPAINGDQPDMLQSLTVENIAAAAPGDFHSLDLWLDLNHDNIWQSEDSLIGSLAPIGAAWEINDLSVEVASDPPTLFIVSDIDDSTAVSSSFRARIPVGGCRYASDNDGPIDSSLTASNTVTVSSSRLAVTVGNTGETYSVGQPIVIHLTVTNRSDEILPDVSGEIFGEYDTSLVFLETSLNGPTGLGPQESTEFEYTFTALKPGAISWFLRALTPSVPDSSAIIETMPVVIQSAPGPVTVKFVNSIPTAVIKGQANVFPLSISYAHPDTQPTAASLRLDSLCLSVKDGTGLPLSASSVFSRLSLVTGYASLMVMEAIPGQSLVWLVFDEPVIVTPGQEQRYSLLVDIDDAASAANFSLAIENAAAIPISDRNTGLPAIINPTVNFPLKTAACRIDNPSRYMFVASESVAGPTANYGQSDVAVLRLDLRHPGLAGSSQIQFTSLELQCVDSLDEVFEIGGLFDEVTVRKQTTVIGGAWAFDLDSTVAVINFYSPVTLSAGETEALTIYVSIRDITAHSGFGLRVSDSTALTVRDLSSGSMLDAATDTLILATGLSAFPLTSDWVTLKHVSQPPEVCPISQMPTYIIAGVDSLKLLEVSVYYPVDTDYSSLYIRSARLAILDTTDRPIGPDLLFDRIGYSIGGNPIAYQSYVTMENGQVVFTFGTDGIMLNPGDNITVGLRADIKPDAPFDHFLFRIEDAASVSVIDASDTSFNPGLAAASGCSATLPFESNVTQIFMPAGRPGLRTFDLPVITAYPGQRAAQVFDCQISYESPTPQGDVLISGLKGNILKRTVSGTTPVDGGEIFETINLSINGQPTPGNAILNADTLSLTLADDQVISRGENFTLSLIGDIKADAPLGNYIICFADSTFMEMADRELATAVYPTLTGALYPLYSAEISLAAADLNGSFRNFPNPFYPSRGEATHIAYTLSSDAYVDIEIFSITGDGVKTVAVNSFREAGSHQEDIWTGLNDLGLPVVSGTYFCRITARYVSGTEDEKKIKIAVLR